MPADLVPKEAIPELAARVDSPELLRALRRVQQAGFILRGAADQQTASILQRLAGLGLVDPGYEGTPSGKPFIWVMNQNGERVLRYFEGALASRVHVHPLARTVLASLPEAEQQAVLATVEALLNRDPASWPAAEVARLSPDKPEYLLRVPPDLRAFVRVLEPGGVELLDVIPEEPLRRFLERHRAEGKAG
jgi:hypothetical protein